MKRGKNDAADAEAICEAATRPSMRFVPVKSAEQQGVLMLHRARDQLVRQRTGLVNALRALLAEFGIVVAKGVWHVGKLTAILADAQDERIPEFAHLALSTLSDQLSYLDQQVTKIERDIVAWHRRNELSCRLATIPGVGPITASALVASITDPAASRSGRHLAAWIGLVPRQNSTGGKERLGRISKQGDRDLRRLLVVGATAVLGHTRSNAATGEGWIVGLLARKPARVVTAPCSDLASSCTVPCIASALVVRPQPGRSARGRQAVCPRFLTLPLVMAEAMTWRRLNGENQLPKVVQGVTFTNGVEVTEAPDQTAA